LTHYPLLLDRLKRLASWPVVFIDPAPAIARRVVDLLGPAGAGAPAGATSAIRARMHEGRPLGGLSASETFRSPHGA